MSTQLISRPTVVLPFNDVDLDVTVGTRPAAPAQRTPFWLTDQQLSVADRNFKLAQYSRSSRSTMAM